MEVVLLERVEKLGVIGDVVNVKAGFARNFLLPQGKALRANKANIERFEREREVIEKQNEEKRDAAAKEGETIEGEVYLLIRQAGETGHLYGSVSARDIANAIGDSVAKSQVVLHSPIKEVGVHNVRINLHPEVSISVQVNVARTPEEGERQARGEDVISSARDDDKEAASEVAEEQAAAMFDPEAEVELETAASDEGTDTASDKTENAAGANEEAAEQSDD